MAKTRLISPGSIPNHKLLKNLQLQDRYISNDGGDEGLKLTDAGNTIVTGNLYLDDEGGEFLYGDGTDLYIEASNIVKFYKAGANKLNLSFDGSNNSTFTSIVGNIILTAARHVEFDGCGVGFDKETTTFAAAAVTSEGDDSTDIDFRLGNKHELTLTDDLAGSGENLNLIFPAASGNFLLTLIQGVADCTIASTAWQAYASDETLCDNLAGQNLPDGRVRWGSVGAPTLSTSQYAIDIVSFYWDADNQTVFGIISQGF